MINVSIKSEMSTNRGCLIATVCVRWHFECSAPQPTRESSSHMDYYHDWMNAQGACRFSICDTYLWFIIIIMEMTGWWHNRIFAILLSVASGVTIATRRPLLLLLLHFYHTFRRRRTLSCDWVTMMTTTTNSCLAAALFTYQIITNRSILIISNRRRHQLFSCIPGGRWRCVAATASGHQHADPSLAGKTRGLARELGPAHFHWRCRRLCWSGVATKMPI